MSAQGLFILAGIIAFAGNAKKSDGFPDNGYATIAATVALTFLGALTKGSRVERPIRALAVLSLLVAVYYYVPIFNPEGKSKKHG